MAIQGHGASRLVEQLLRTDLRDTYFMDNKTISNCREMSMATQERGWLSYIPLQKLQNISQKLFLTSLKTTIKYFLVV